MLGQLEEAHGTQANLNEIAEAEKSSFAIGMEQAQLSMGEGIEDEAYTKVISGFEDYRDNSQYYDAWKNVSVRGSSNVLDVGLNITPALDNLLSAGKQFMDIRYARIIEDNMFKLDMNDNVVRGANAFIGAELLYDMDAVKGMLLATKNGFNDLVLKTAYSEITKAKSQELAQQAEGKSLIGRVGGVMAGHIAQPETVADMVLSPQKVMGKTILKGMVKAAGIEAFVMLPGEISREQRTRQHMEAAGLEYGLWDSVQNVLINSGLGGFIRGAGSGIVDANTIRKMNKDLAHPMDKAMVNAFFKRESDKLTMDTNKHIALVQKSLNDMNANRAVDVAQHTDIDINAKTDPNVEAISLDDELTKKDMANGYQDEVQNFENDYAKAEPIPDEPYIGDIRPDQELDTYAGMATKEEGDARIKEMGELDNEIVEEAEWIKQEMTLETERINKRSEAAKNRIEEKRNRLEKEFGADEDKIKEGMRVPQKKKVLPTEESIYKGMSQEELDYLDEMNLADLEAEAMRMFSLTGGDPLGGALGGGFAGGTEGLYEDMVEGKDLSKRDYLMRIIAGMAIGAGLGAKYGGKGGAKSFVGAKEEKPLGLLARAAAEKEASIKPKGREITHPRYDKTYLVGDDGNVYWESRRGWRESKQFGLKKELEEIDKLGAEEFIRKEEEASTAMEQSIKDYQNMEDTYKMEHTAPTASDSNARADDLKPVFGDDIYRADAARLFGHGDKKMDNDSIKVIKSMKDSPEKEITIYRAVPKNIDIINDGDWITINKAYAKVHGEGPMGGDYKIIEKKVKAKDLYTDGNSIHEWGYSPENMTTNKEVN